MGRKNYLFSKNDNGAIDNTIFYSLLESCDIVGVDKFEWLEYTLKNLKKNASKEEAKIFTPYNYKKTRNSHTSFFVITKSSLFRMLTNKFYRKRSATAEAFYVTLDVTEEGIREVLGILNMP